MINRKKFKATSIIFCAIFLNTCESIRVPVDWSEIQPPVHRIHKVSKQKLPKYEYQSSAQPSMGFQNPFAGQLNNQWVPLSQQIRQPQYAPPPQQYPAQHTPQYQAPYQAPQKQWNPMKPKKKKIGKDHYHGESVKQETVFKAMEPHLEIPKFAQKIYENDPFITQGSQIQSRSDQEEEISQEEEEVHEVPQDKTPISEHEVALDIPTKPVYPGEGEWARPGRKHKVFVRPKPVHEYDENEELNAETTPDGYEIFEDGIETFGKAKAEFKNKLSEFPKEHNLRVKAEASEEENSSLYEKPKIRFVPLKTYAQIRRSENVRHLPQSEAYKEASTDEEVINAPRLKEVIKNTRAHTYYTEEGYEDEAYDHAGKEKKAENQENTKYLEHDLEKYKEVSKARKKAKSAEEGGKIRGYNNEKQLVNEDLVDEDVEDLVEENYKTADSNKKDKRVGYEYRKKPKSWGKESIKEKRKTEINNDTLEVATNMESIHHPNGLSLKKQQFIVANVNQTKHRVKRYDRDRLSKIYIRRYPDYYWKKSKNRGNMKIENTENSVRNQPRPSGNPSAPLPKTFANYLTKNRTKRNIDDFNLNIDELKYDIVDVEKLKLPESTPDETHIKYPYYLMSESKLFNQHSPLKYAEDLGRIPVKTEGGMEFYESTSGVQCPEVDADVNPVPERVENKDGEDEEDQKSPPEANIRRLKGLGDKIDCMKIKYFGDNPLDSPFFKEEIIAPPSVDDVFPKPVKSKPLTHIQHIAGKVKPAASELMENMKKIVGYLNNGTNKVKRDVKEQKLDTIVVLDEPTTVEPRATSEEPKQATTKGPKQTTTEAPKRRTSNEDFVIIINTNGENIEDIPLQLPLVDDKHFADTFDINKYFPKYDLKAPEVYDHKTKSFKNRPSKDQMAVFADILQHLTTLAPKPLEKTRRPVASTTPTNFETTETSTEPHVIEKVENTKRKIKVPHKRMKMTVTNSTLDPPGVATIFDQMGSPSQHEEVGQEALEAEDLVDNPKFKYPGTFNSLYVQDNDIINRDVFTPKDHYPNVAEYSSDPNHPVSNYNHAPQISDHFHNIGNPPPPQETYKQNMKYDLVYNRVKNSYVLRPTQHYRYETGFQPMQAPLYQPIINSPKLEEVIIHGIQPQPHPMGMKFIIPQSKLPIRKYKSPVRYLKLRLKPKKIVRYQPPAALLIPLPSYYRRRITTQTHQADYYNIDGMVPPIHNEHVISYSDYNPVQFGNQATANSDITPSYTADSIADEDSNQIQGKSFKDLQMESSDNMESVVDLSGKPISRRKYMLELDRTNRQANYFQTTTEAEEITPMEGEVLMLSPTEQNALLDSYGKSISKPMAKTYSTLISQMKTESKKYLSEPHQPLSRQRRPKAESEATATLISVDVRRGEPKYEIQRNRGSRTAIDTIPGLRGRSKFQSRMDHPELSIFKVMQSPEVFDINKFIPEAKFSKKNYTKKDISTPNESYKSGKYSSRFNSANVQLPLATERTLQKPVVLVIETINRTVEATTIPTSTTEPTTVEPKLTTTQRVISLRRKRPVTTEASIRTALSRARSTPRINREEPRSIRKTTPPSKLAVDPIALRHKARLEEAKLAHQLANQTDEDELKPKGRHFEKNEQHHTTSRIVHTKIYDPEEPKEEDEIINKDFSELVEIIGDLAQIRTGPKHGGNYRHISDQKPDRGASDQKPDDTNHDDKASGRHDDDDDEEEQPRKSKYSTYKYDFPDSKHSRSSSIREKVETKEKDNKEDDFDDDFAKTSNFFSDQTLPKKINNLRHQSGPDDSLIEDFVEGLETAKKVVTVRPESLVSRRGAAVRATWSKIIKDPQMRQYFYVRE